MGAIFHEEVEIQTVLLSEMADAVSLFIGFHKDTAKSSPLHGLTSLTSSVHGIFCPFLQELQTKIQVPYVMSVARHFATSLHITRATRDNYSNLFCFQSDVMCNMQTGCLFVDGLLFK